MKKCIGHELVEFIEYVAEDGKVFKDKDECILYERKLNGEIIECPKCHGKGKVPEEYEYDNYHTGEPMVTTIYPTCKKCNGKGYLEKKVKVVFE